MVRGVHTPRRVHVIPEPNCLYQPVDKMTHRALYVMARLVSVIWAGPVPREAARTSQVMASRKARQTARATRFVPIGANPDMMVGPRLTSPCHDTEEPASGRIVPTWLRQRDQGADGG
jgi:hypothetical protein